MTQNTFSTAIRIALIEDFHGETEIVLRELKDSELRFEHRTVNSEAAFLELLKDYSPDVILTPYSLRGTNAIKLLNIARSERVEAPFILLAFDLSEDIAIDLLAEGIEDYVQRSTLKRLPVSIRKALSRYKTQLELMISEARLRSSEESLQEAQRIAKIGSWEWDVGAEYVWWSDEMYRIYETEKRNIKLSEVKEFIHPEDREYVDSVARNDLSKEMSPVIEYRILIRQGVVKHVVSSANQVLNKEGNVVRLIGTLQDVTEKVLEQESLQAERIQRELAISASGIGFWHIDFTDGVEATWDDRCFELFGISNKKLSAQDFFSILQPEDRKMVEEKVLEALVSGKYKAEYRIIRGGETRYIQAAGRTAFDSTGKAIRLNGVLQDITENRATAERIETLSLVASETINGVLIHEPDGTVSWANKGFTRITGYSENEIIGKEPWSVVSGPETNEKLIELTYKKLKSGKPFVSDNRLRHKDGHSVWVNTSFTPIMDESGTIIKVVSIGTDITKQKEVEGLQSSMLERLESRFQDRTEELQKTNKELQEEMWEKERLSDELYHSNLDLKDSILYAKRIQTSILPTEKQIRESFPESFVLYKPRDVVSGDFYWHYKRDERIYFATIDCTGHGVPGALMSMIANELMNQVIIQRKLTDPSDILELLNKLMVRTLRQKEDANMRDGMDLSLCVIDQTTNTLAFAGALGNLYLSHAGKISMYPGTRHSIGGHLEDVRKEFETKHIPLSKGDTVYLTTDGYIDQFGGTHGKKFMKKRFEALISELQKLPMAKQKIQLDAAFNKWKGPLNQVDDVLVAGLRY